MLESALHVGSVAEAFALGCTKDTAKVAFFAGSSKQGNARRA
jgi:hypothetical protein